MVNTKLTINFKYQPLSDSFKEHGVLYKKYKYINSIYVMTS